MLVLAKAMDHGVEGSNNPAPRASHGFGNFARDQALAFDGQFHCLAAIGPEIRFIHIGVPFGQSGRTLPPMLQCNIGQYFGPINRKTHE